LNTQHGDPLVLLSPYSPRSSAINDATLVVGHTEAFIVRTERHIEPGFRHIDSDKHVIFHSLPPTRRPSLRDTGLLTLATVRALRFLSGRDDLNAAHGLENLGQGRPIAPGLTQIGEVMKIQGQGGRRGAPFDHG
jgi:hypothetical protein